MRILFYIIHPAKYYLFRFAINELKKKHTVDLIINSKDVLEELVRSERWKYTNIFPKGRNISTKPSIIRSGLKFLLTIMLLERYIITNKKYDLYITDDALVINGWWRKIPTYIFNDNDITTIKINKILFYFAYKIISPESTYLGSFSKKQICFKGNKAVAHLSPKYFKPSLNIIAKYNILKNNYGIIRLSKLNATHDIGNTGITDMDLDILVKLCSGYGKVLISTERQINEKYKELLYYGNPQDMPHMIYYAKYFIGDSTSMATEAALLGVPNIVINKLAKICGVNMELAKYGLQNYYDSFSDAIEKIKEIIINRDLEKEYQIKARKYIEQCTDFNEFLLKLIFSFKRQG